MLHTRGTVENLTPNSSFGACVVSIIVRDGAQDWHRRIGIYLRREGGESLGILGSNACFPNHLGGASIKSRLGAVSTRIMCGPEQSCLRVPVQSEKAVLGTKKLGTD